MKPRYTVGSVTGYPIGPGFAVRRSATIWYVYDRLNCYRIVREFKGGTPERQARLLAEKLNAVPAPPMDAWLAGLAPHCHKGHAYTEANSVWYSSRGRLERRCRQCREDFNARRRAQRAAA